MTNDEFATLSYESNKIRGDVLECLADRDVEISISALFQVIGVLIYRQNQQLSKDQRKEFLSKHLDQILDTIGKIRSNEHES